MVGRFIFFFLAYQTGYTWNVWNAIMLRWFMSTGQRLNTRRPWKTLLTKLIYYLQLDFSWRIKTSLFHGLWATHRWAWADFSRWTDIAVKVTPRWWQFICLSEWPNPAFSRTSTLSLAIRLPPNSSKVWVSDSSVLSTRYLLNPQSTRPIEILMQIDSLNKASTNR